MHPHNAKYYKWVIIKQCRNSIPLITYPHSDSLEQRILECLKVRNTYQRDVYFSYTVVSNQSIWCLNSIRKPWLGANVASTFTTTGLNQQFKKKVLDCQSIETGLRDVSVHNDVLLSVFGRQVRRAVEIGKPLVIHSREADEVVISVYICIDMNYFVMPSFKDTFAILQHSIPRWVRTLIVVDDSDVALETIRFICMALEAQT